MNEGWRSEPPDSAGWWLWRLANSSEPFVARVWMRDGVAVVRDDRDGYHPPIRTGQWLKVPE